MNEILRSLSRVPAIVALFCTSSPLTVFWAVPPIIVDTFKGIFFWCFAHVGEKVSKVKPAFANGNPPSAVVLKCRIVRVQTTLLHGFPNRVNATSRFTMFTGINASAGCRYSSAKVGACGHGTAAAFTYAVPSRFFTECVVVSTQHSKFTELLSCKIYALTHFVTSKFTKEMARHSVVNCGSGATLAVLYGV